ncbi:MAG: hypothetical protein EA402_07455 [Planctomycetota bacterium]|nr:MAG: hypothetical protein EA402_07455 [Planctomycetota bacterium]
MAKGSVITHAFVEALGLGSASYTLTKAIKNQLHPELQDPMFAIEVEEFPEPIYLDRQYCFDHQFSVPSSYGPGDRLLLWMRRTVRHRNQDSKQPATHLLMASDCFLYDQPLEFQRFRVFLRSKRILDTQARDFLARYGDDFPKLVESPKGMERILDCLGNIAEWPDPENGFRRNVESDASLEGLAKSYSVPLLAVRSHSSLPAELLKRNPEERVNIFRLLCFAEDPNQGSDSLMVFLRDLGAATRAPTVIRRTAAIKSGADLGWALESLRQFLALPLD